MFCSVADVKAAINFPSNNAPISDDAIEEFIKQAEEEIESIYHTKFGSVEDQGIADSATVSTLTDTDKDWAVDSFIGYVVWIYSGTGSPEYREIQSNSATQLVVSPNWDVTPSTDSYYRITKLGYKEDILDGTGTSTMFVRFQPLIYLNALSIDGTSVGTSHVYQYKDSGKLVLGVDAEKTVFLMTEPQQVVQKYIYGVYPLPKLIKRLCILVAGIKTLVSQIAGTYDDFTNVSLPGGVSASKGEPYMNIKNALIHMQKEARGIVFGDDGNNLEDNFNTIPSYRPFANFG